MFASEKRVITNSKFNLIEGTKSAHKLGHAGSVTTYISPEDGSIYPSKNVEGCRQKLGDVVWYTVCSIRLNTDNHDPGFILHMWRESKAKAFEHETLMSQGSTVVID